MGIRRDGREPDELRPLAFTRDFTEFAAGSVLVEFGRDTRPVHRVGGGARAAVDAGDGPGLGHRRVLDAARIDRRAQRPGGGEGQAVGPDPGDPAVDRPVVARRDRPAHDGRGADHRRLRRPPGRRRHPHRVHLRRLPRPPRCLLASRRQEADHGAPRSRTRAARSRSGSSTRSGTSTSTTPRTCGPRST